MNRLEGRNVLITGASSGIGKAIAIRFAQEGANVAINYRSAPEEAEAARIQVREASLTSRSGGNREMTVQADISKQDDVHDMFARVVNELGSVDVLVNNAGIQKPSPSDEIDLDDFDRVLNVNLRGA